MDVFHRSVLKFPLCWYFVCNMTAVIPKCLSRTVEESLIFGVQDVAVEISVRKTKILCSRRQDLEGMR